jgi:hypothetical protein
MIEDLKQHSLKYQGTHFVHLLYIHIASEAIWSKIKKVIPTLRSVLAVIGAAPLLVGLTVGLFKFIV